jgi:hypothetical protein
VVDSSATAFFAIPAPKAQAPKAVAPEEPPAPKAVSSGAAGPAPASIDRPAFPAGGGGIGMGMAGGGTPFQVSGPAPTANSNKEKDVESSRIWVLIIGMFGLALMVVIGVILLIVLIPHQKAPEPVAQNNTPVVKEKADTGTPKQPELPPTVQGTHISKPAPVVKSNTPPPPPPQPSDKVTLVFSGSPVPSSMELFCDNGYRQRGNLSNNAISFGGVPATGCKVIPKGGVVTTDAAVKPGKTYNCTVAGTTLNCH